MKKSISNFKVTKAQQISNYKILYGILDKYEELNLTTYTRGNQKKLIIADPEN